MMASHQSGRYVPEYPGCEGQRRWLKTWTFLWPAKVTAGVCLMLMLAMGPALAQETERTKPSGQETQHERICRGKVAEPPPCRGDVAEPPPCRGEMVAPPPPCLGSPPPPCTGVAMPPIPPDNAYDQYSLSDFHQQAADLVGRRVELSGRLERHGDGNMTWDGLYVTGEPAGGTPTAWFGCPLIGDMSPDRVGARVTVRGIVERVELDPARHGRAGTVMALRVESLIDND